MIEPTETESKETLDFFIDAMRQIASEAEDTPDWSRERRIRRNISGSTKSAQTAISISGETPAREAVAAD